ncbi:MAG: hypothetical protein KGJ13_10210 [Patescibacteria group bacterium]|nr:hypothetical protein [Patescibacteria group bacterium]
MKKKTNNFGLGLSSGASHALYCIATNIGKIEAIEMVRWKSGMGLVESKNWVNQFLEQYEKMKPELMR